MQLVYYRRKRVPNFGDDLNAVLWQGLAPDLFDDDPEVGFVGIGTIIGMPCGEVGHLHVFSSGVGYEQFEAWRGKQVEYWCVRGPISSRMLGLPEDRAITDGAILTPLVDGFPKAAMGGAGTVIIPHFQTLDHPGWPEVATLTGYELLDPRSDPRSIIARIAAAKLVLTESLHGAILADTYGIPWIAFATSKNLGITKWVDWTLSLGLPFDLTMIPPPDPGPILAFGRTPAPFGQTVRFGAEEALARFDERVAPAPVTLTSRVKGLIKRSRLIRPLLAFSPARTAEALTRLARAEPALSLEARRQELRGRMLERLATLEAAA
ncbi:polysaccharide pyruvyl transferase family protein [Roseicella aquatilis]|uniref:Polysaccharide pyruvyl transferase family protein n=1 Tax=Roseicella aquatilis TaxID=2527868 RepID=A0A4R4D2Q4_9PROT|nr:polysaccharide pyruvyl transferase family protein [Roseicella aquatilis]TCZ52270.1 polysaccharide pyruvyl transferase family protein [Roseicella aquatilis]